MEIHFQLGGESIPSGQKYRKKCKMGFPHPKKKCRQQNYPLVFSCFTYVGKCKGKKAKKKQQQPNFKQTKKSPTTFPIQ